VIVRLVDGPRKPYSKKARREAEAALKATKETEEP